MSNTTRAIILSLFFASLAICTTAHAQFVGEPQAGGPGGTFRIKITHGNTVVLDNPLAPFPLDVKNDGNGLQFVVLSYLDPPTNTRPITLKVESYGGALELNRLLSFYIQVPLQTPGPVIDINTPGPQSLFSALNADPIAVEVSHVRFVNTPGVKPLLFDLSTALVSYMRDKLGRFYRLRGSNEYVAPPGGFGEAGIQVCGKAYLDTNVAPFIPPIFPIVPADYTFKNTCGLVTGNWAWQQLISPGQTAQVAQGALSVPSGSGGGAETGFVFELGLAVIFASDTPTSFADFINGLLQNPPPVDLCPYDINLDGLLNGLDIIAYVDQLFP
jgi:hypothetical protein